LLIEKKLSEQAAQSEEGNRAERRMAHHSVERGNAQLVFYGMKFESLKS
jgi:peptide chain release factor